ncbi:MAG: hypothetical protein AABW59_05765 [archaeon]
MVKKFVKWIDAQKALQTLGVSKQYYLAFIGPQGRPVNSAHLKRVDAFIRHFGPESLMTFLSQRVLKEGARSEALFERMERVLKVFGKPFLGMANFAEKKNVQMEFIAAPDNPFGSSVEFSALDGTKIAKFNFDLFINSQRKPAVVLGNLQGMSRQEMEGFKARYNEPFFNFVLGSFERAFPKRTQRLALNPREHRAYMQPKTRNIIGRLVSKGTINQEKFFEFVLRESEKRKISIDGVERLIAQGKVGGNYAKILNLELEMIRQRGRGMHMAAYKKAGFNPRSKAKFLRVSRR